MSGYTDAGRKYQGRFVSDKRPTIPSDPMGKKGIRSSSVPRWRYELLREKHGVADRWVRFIGPDNESTTPVRLDPVEKL